MNSLLLFFLSFADHKDSSVCMAYRAVCPLQFLPRAVELGMQVGGGWGGGVSAGPQ